MASQGSSDVAWPGPQRALGSRPGCTKCPPCGQGPGLGAQDSWVARRPTPTLRDGPVLSAAPAAARLQSRASPAGERTDRGRLAAALVKRPVHHSSRMNRSLGRQWPHCGEAQGGRLPGAPLCQLPLLAGTDVICKLLRRQLLGEAGHLLQLFQPPTPALPAPRDNRALSLPN